MSTIKINELATTGISLTDFLVKADANGYATKNTMQGLQDFLSTLGDTSFKGTISAGTYATKDAGWYFASNTGNYVMGSTTIAVDVSDTLTIIIVPSFINDSSKVEIPINITFDATPTTGSTNAVTSEGIKAYVDSKEVATSPTPVDGGTDAFSNGGAFTELAKKAGNITENVVVVSGGVNSSNGSIIVSAGSQTTKLRSLDRLLSFKITDSNTYNSGQNNVYWFIENNDNYTLVSSENISGTNTVLKANFPATATHVVVTAIVDISPNFAFLEYIDTEKYVLEETNFIDGLLKIDNFNEDDYNLRVSILDLNEYQNSKRIDPISGVEISSGASNNLSGYGEVNDGKTYKTGFLTNLFCFDEKFNFIAERSDLIVASTEFTIPSNLGIKYVRILCPSDNLLVQKDYIINTPSGEFLPTYNEKKVLTQKNIYQLPLQGFGDSIIARYLSGAFEDLTGRKCITFSYGGCISSLIRDQFINLVKIDNCVPFIYLGHNNSTETDVVIDDIAVMVKHLGHQRFLIASSPTGTYGSEAATIDFVNSMKKIETRLEATYGKNYLNMRKAAVDGYDMGGVRLTQSFVQPPLDGVTTVDIYIDKFEFMTTYNTITGTQGWIPAQNLFKIGLNDVYDEYEIVSSTLVGADDGYLTCKLVTNNRIAIGSNVENLALSQVPAGEVNAISFIKYLKIAKSADLYLKSLETCPSSFDEDFVHPSKWGGAFTAEQIAIRLSTLNY